MIINIWYHGQDFVPVDSQGRYYILLIDVNTLIMYFYENVFINSYYITTGTFKNEL